VNLTSTSRLFESRLGLSLIELLVSVAALMMLVGLGIPSYLEFNKKQRMRESKQQIESLVELGITKAKSGQVGPCHRLSGYQVYAVTNTEIKMRPICSEGTTPTWGETEVYYELPKDIFLSDAECLAFEFKSVNSEIRYIGNGPPPSWLSNDPPWEIRLSDGDDVYGFSLSQFGTFTEGEWNPS
jgi:type II secretory pathway pseudopilin PulG